MGCTSSKIDDLPAVALCRDRCALLDEAIHYRYALSEAHLAYLHSLKTVGLSLHHFFHQNVDLSSSTSETPHSPVRIKGDPPPPEPPKKPPPAAVDQNHDSHSSSGSHLHFHSDSDEDDGSGSESLHHQYGHFAYGDHEMPGLGAPYPVGGSGRGGFMHMNFMRNQTTPSVTYEQQPVSTETVRMSEASSSSYYPYPYTNNHNPNSYDNYSDYPNYGGGFFSTSTTASAAAAGPSLAPSSSKPPPPPPSPPRSSPWEFLNPFETFESYPIYTPSRDSREVREEEGIPDLEDEDFEHEVVKEVHEDQRFVDEGAGGSYSKAVEENENEKAADSEAIHQSRPSSSTEDDPVEYEVHVVDKKVVDEESRGNVSGSKC